MSTTNRAFIKAYRQDPAEESRAGGSSPTMRSQNAAAARGATVGAASTTTSTGGSVRPDFDRQRSGHKRPLSTFIARPHVAAPPAQNLDSNILEPGTTLASFHWPQICRTLNQQAGPQLERVADVLRTQADSGHSLIGVMGMFPRVGATTATLCLASRAARRVRRAIMVDANLCGPRIAPWLEVVPTVGWEDVLKHASPLADAVIRATDDNLDLLALGAKAVKDPHSLAKGLQAAVTAGVLRHAYDLVLIDLGAFFDPTSQPVVLELVRNMGIDTVIAVAGPEPADPRDMATIAEYLDPLNCQLMGTIENRAPKPHTI
jgi:Mrp family chromosome partitioning ATPase